MSFNLLQVLIYPFVTMISFFLVGHICGPAVDLMIIALAHIGQFQQCDSNFLEKSGINVYYHSYEPLIY